EVGLNPLLRESAAQIAVAQFGERVGAEVPLSGLPAMAQIALSQFAGRGITPHIVFSHVTSRQDTGRVSDKIAAKMLAMAASARPGDQNRTVELVRMAMQMFGTKRNAGAISFIRPWARRAVAGPSAQTEGNESRRT